MYLVGRAHPNKDRSIELIRNLVNREVQFATSVEVFQEILHRYQSIGGWRAMDDACAWLERTVDKTLSYDIAEIRHARKLLKEIGGLSARDALHIAVMKSANIRQVLSFDRGFDLCPDVERVH